MRESKPEYIQVNRTELCEFYGVSPSPETMIDIWCSDAEDLLLLWEGDNESSDFAFRLLCIHGRLKRCDPALLVDPELKTLVENVDKACDGLPKELHRELLGELSFEAWIDAANELAKKEKNEESLDPELVCQLLEGLDDADCLIAACPDEELREQRGLKLDECLLWMRDHFSVWVHAANWILSVEETLASFDVLEKTNMLDTTDKYQLWIEQMENSILASEVAPFDRWSDEELSSMYNEFCRQRNDSDNGKQLSLGEPMIVELADFRADQSASIPLSMAAGSLDSEKSRKAFDEDESGLKVFRVPVQGFGSFELQLADKEFKAYFSFDVVPEQSLPASPPELRTKLGGEEKVQTWLPLPGRKTFQTEPFLAQSIAIVTSSGTLTMQLPTL